jgi:spore coat polysaccharide biosynthesis protein SpsF
MIRGSIAIILQARMGSSRLPGKAMAPINGVPIITRCLARLCSAGRGRVVLATTTQPDDDALVAAATRAGVRVFRGDADDVLGRFARVTEQVSAQYVVRATADNPAVDPGSILRLTDAVMKQGADHAVEVGLPLGCTVEVVTAAALLDAAGRATLPDDREHVTPFIRRESSGFTCVSLPAPAAVTRPDLRFTIDTAADLDYMRRVFAAAERAPCRQTALKDLIAAAEQIGPRSEAA